MDKEDELDIKLELDFDIPIEFGIHINLEKPQKIWSFMSEEDPFAFPLNYDFIYRLGIFKQEKKNQKSKR